MLEEAQPSSACTAALDGAKPLTRVQFYCPGKVTPLAPPSFQPSLQFKRQFFQHGQLL